MAGYNLPAISILPYLRKAYTVAWLGGLACLLSFIFSTSVFYRDMEYRGYDSLVGIAHPPASSEIVVVDIDDSTLQRIGKFPMPRSVVTDLVRRVSAASPELIGLDLLLTEPRTAEEDQEMAQVLRESGNVVIASQLGSTQMPVADPLPEFCKPETMSVPYCEPGGAFAVGFINLPVDEDGFIRRMFVLPRREHTALPFPVVLASNFRKKPIRPCGAAAVCIGEQEVALDGSGTDSAMIAGWSAAPAATISASKVIAGDFKPAELAGKIVLIGQSSTAGGDRHFTPVFRPRQSDGSRLMLSGTQIHAAAIHTLLAGKNPAVVPAVKLWSLNFVLAYTTLFAVLYLRLPLSLAVWILLAIFGYVLALLLLHGQHLWLRFIATEGSLLFALPLGLGYRFLEERWLKRQAAQERAQIMALFSRYVSPEVADEIWMRRNEVVLAGKETTATVLFSDIRNFTAITAGQPSSEVLAWLNDYFTAMAAIVKEEGGYLNKFIGDGIMVVFGVPLSRGVQQDALAATRTATRMLQRVEELNTNQKNYRFPAIKIGIGIHTGQLTAGNVGARDRLEYSVIGETVNLASRLESLCKDFKTEIVISPQTRELIEAAVPNLALGEAKVRGFEGEVRLYTVNRTNDSLKSATGL